MEEGEGDGDAPVEEGGEDSGLVERGDSDEHDPDSPAEIEDVVSDSEDEERDESRDTVKVDRLRGIKRPFEDSFEVFKN